jgi:hypothetical protein
MCISVSSVLEGRERGGVECLSHLVAGWSGRGGGGWEGEGWVSLPLDPVQSSCLTLSLLLILRGMFMPVVYVLLGGEVLGLSVSKVCP